MELSHEPWKFHTLLWLDFLWLNSANRRKSDGEAQNYYHYRYRVAYYRGTFGCN
jgi:hypothetical protein